MPSSQEYPYTIESKPPTQITYLNNAGKTPIPPQVQLAGLKALSYESHPWKKDDTSTTLTNSVRTLFSQLIHSNTTATSNNANIGNDIAICPSTSFALTLAAHNLYRQGRITDKDIIVILQDEMSSAVYCWQEICHLSGATIVVVPHPDNHEDHHQGWTKAVCDTIQQYTSSDVRENNGHRVSILCVPQVHWSDGSLLDLKQLGALCLERDITFIVDATQSVGVYPIHVDEINCDVLAASVHKWLLGPHGMSLMYIHEKYHEEWLPLDQHERSRIVFQSDVFDAGENRIDYYDNDNTHNSTTMGYPEEFVTGAARCDAGGKKNPILIPMVEAGLKIVNSLDLTHVQNQLRVITEAIITGARKFGLDVQPGPHAHHMIGLRPSSSPDYIALKEYLTPERMVEITKRLAEKKGIFIAARSGAFRISPYLDTTMEDVSRLLSALQEECNIVKQNCILT